ncbi:prephenate dehydrogenase [Streptomyces sp. Ru71]|uniref:prephenate dehydrogenase n=1 Tax=Streptomyces sp. Ru71 TaxID=2080746 RepID=UPI000CDE28DD|nr:prephenate dehydrogenase [Streptomyces sp. Ru71]POX57139.1 prephenate dehydrogenase [Streptomyces sp. Ru71]
MRTAAVVGTGLIGTSIALALTHKGVRVYLQDADESAARTAESLGAGVCRPPEGTVDLAVLAVPPGRIGAVLAEKQACGLARGYTDVASVKAGPQAEVDGSGADPALFIGGHPMAGRERSGPLAACATLFKDRPWVLTPSAATDRETVNRALELVSLCGALPVLMQAERHDRAVAVVSHAPHVVASLMAARLVGIEDDAARLAGQGLRDVIRIAGGDPRLWSDILAANAGAVADVLGELAEDLTTTVAALRGLASADPDDRALGDQLVSELLCRGTEGRACVPDKHSAVLPVCSPVRVLIGDQPGELARLLAAASELGVNIEDMTIDHSPGSPSGLVELTVTAASAVQMARRLRADGWNVQRVPAAPGEGFPEPLPVPDPHPAATAA